jgi:hypothetical protein
MIVFAALAAAEPQWTVTADPLTWSLGFAHVQVERALAPRWSLYAGPSLRVHDGWLPDDLPRTRGIGAEVGVRGFFTGRAPEGAWVMVRGVGAVVRTIDAPRRTGPGGYTSALVGGTGVLGRGFVLSGGLGVSWFAYGVDGLGRYGPLPAAHTNLGWAF